MADGAAREEAFKAKRETMQKSLSNHAKNVEDFCRLGEEKSQQILDLKVSVIGLEAELQLKTEARAKKERQLTDAEAKAKREQPLSNEDVSRISSILIECCYQRLQDVYTKERVDRDALNFYYPEPY